MDNTLIIFLGGVIVGALLVWQFLRPMPPPPKKEEKKKKLSGRYLVVNNYRSVYGENPFRETFGEDQIIVEFLDGVPILINGQEPKPTEWRVLSDKSNWRIDG